MKGIFVKKVKPQYTTVITTLDVWEDNVVQNGTIVAKKGEIKPYQTVVAVGDNVRCVKEGDFVIINLINYVKRNFEEDSLKEGMNNMQEEKVFDVPQVAIGDKIYAKLAERDIEYVILDYEEVELETASANSDALDNNNLL